MSYCFNPTCTRPENPNTNRFCHYCGTPLRLGDRFRGSHPHTLLSASFIARDEHLPSQPRQLIQACWRSGDQPVRSTADLQHLEAISQQHHILPPLSAIIEQTVRSDYGDHLIQYIAQVLPPGLTLAQQMSESGAWAEPQVQAFLAAVLPLLETLHQDGILHGSLSLATLIRPVQELGWEAPTQSPNLSLEPWQLLGYRNLQRFDGPVPLEERWVDLRALGLIGAQLLAGEPLKIVGHNFAPNQTFPIPQEETLRATLNDLLAVSSERVLSAATLLAELQRSPEPRWTPAPANALPSPTPKRANEPPIPDLEATFVEDPEATFLDLPFGTPETDANPFELIAELVVEPVVEPIAGTVLEPIAETEIEIGRMAEPFAEAEIEPIAEVGIEPVVEPIAESIAEPALQPIDWAEIESITESIAEPTLQPIAETVIEPIANADPWATVPSDDGEFLFKPWSELLAEGPKIPATIGTEIDTEAPEPPIPQEPWTDAPTKLWLQPPPPPDLPPSSATATHQSSQLLAPKPVTPEPVTPGPVTPEPVIPASLPPTLLQSPLPEAATTTLTNADAQSSTTVALSIDETLLETLLKTPQAIDFMALMFAQQSNCSAAADAPYGTCNEYFPAAEWQQLQAILAQPNTAEPQDQAIAYLAVAAFYRDRLKQDATALSALVLGILAYEQALVHRLPTTQLQIAAHQDLGRLYWLLSLQVRSDRQRALERAISHYEQALTPLVPQTNPETYIDLQNHRGEALGALAQVTGTPEFWQDAIDAYHLALEVCSPEQLSERYATVQNNLGTAYWNLAQYFDPSEHLQKAIAAYNSAALHLDPDRAPVQYGMIQNNLGTAYLNLANTEQSIDLLRLAVGVYQIAALYRNPETMPAAHATTQNNLGMAALQLATHPYSDPLSSQENLDMAIAAYETTLALVTAARQAGDRGIPGIDPIASRLHLGLAHQRLATLPYLSVAKLTAETPAGTTVPSDPARTLRFRHLQAALDAYMAIWVLQGSNASAQALQPTLQTYLDQTILYLTQNLGIEPSHPIFAKIPTVLARDLRPVDQRSLVAMNELNSI